MTRRLRIDRYDGPTTLGVDVSSHQGEIDWHRVATAEATLDGRAQGRVRYAVVRTSDGLHTSPSRPEDERAEANLRGAAAAGLLVAAYVYLRACYSGAEQVALALDVIASAGVDVPWIGLDVEGGESDASGIYHRLPDGARITTARALDCLREAADAVELSGRRAVVYTGTTWQWEIAQPGLCPPWCRWPLWVPDYVHGPGPRLPVDARGRPAPWSTWLAWQYASDGRVDGVRGRVDLDRYRGDEDALRAWWG